MKRLFSIVFTLLIAFSLSSCKNSDNSSEKAMNPAEAEQKIMDIYQKVQDGELSSEEANRMSESLKAELKNNQKSSTEILIESNKDFKVFDGMPDWAKKLGFDELEDLTLNKKDSSIGLENAEKHLGRSVTLTYTGDKEVIKREAKKIIKEFDINIFQEGEDYMLASGELNVGNGYLLDISFRTDIDVAIFTFNLSHDYTVKD